jgi:hypothetical protein
MPEEGVRAVAEPTRERNSGPIRPISDDLAARVAALVAEFGVAAVVAEHETRP